MSLLLLLCQQCLIRYFGANVRHEELFDERSLYLLVTCQLIYSSNQPVNVMYVPIQIKLVLCLIMV